MHTPQCASQRWQARELQTTLAMVVSALPVVVRTGKNYVEACLKGVNKGVMADMFVGLCTGKPSAPPLEMVISVGDDSTDELMFAALNAKLGKGPCRLVHAAKSSRLCPPTPLMAARPSSHAHPLGSTDSSPRPWGESRRRLATILGITTR